MATPRAPHEHGRIRRPLPLSECGSAVTLTIIRRVWAPKGQRPIALGHHRYKWLYVTAFVQPISGEVFWSVSNGVSKPFFAALLALFAREAGAGRDRIIVLGLDSAGWHTAPNLAVPDGIRPVYLPPYSPELQPAEHL